MPTTETVKAALTAFQLPAYAFLGAWMLYVMNRLYDKQPFSLFKVLNINVGRTAPSYVILLDIVLSSALGVAVIMPLIAPATIAQAVAAGLGMTGVLSAHAKKAKSGR